MKEQERVYVFWIYLENKKGEMTGGVRANHRKEVSAHNLKEAIEKVLEVKPGELEERLKIYSEPMPSYPKDTIHLDKEVYRNGRVAILDTVYDGLGSLCASFVAEINPKKI